MIRRVLPGLLAVLAALAWIALGSRPDGRLHLHVLPLPDGGALLLRLPDGAEWLVGGGENPVALLEAVDRARPFLAGSLDGVVALEARDRLGLAGPLRHRGSRWAWTPSGTPLGGAGEGIPTYPLQPGLRIRRAGVTLEVRAVDPPVLTLSFGRPLLCLAPHGGAAVCPATPLLWLAPRAPLPEGVRPTLVLLTPGRRGPDPALLLALEAVGAAYLRADLTGPVELVSDGVRLWSADRRVRVQWEGNGSAR